MTKMTPTIADTFFAAGKEAKGLGLHGAAWADPKFVSLMEAHGFTFNSPSNAFERAAVRRYWQGYTVGGLN